MKKLLLAFALIPLNLFGQANLVKILVPIAVNEPIAGAYGSQWISVLTIHNSGTGPAGVDATDPLCVIETCHFFSLLQPGETGVVQPARNGMAFGGPGAFIWGSQATVQRLRFRLRIQDLSRQSSTWGTEIPVVLETEALTAKAQFLDVPTDVRFRQTLRIYDFDALENAELIIAGNTYGVARKATIVPITVADCSGDATTETVVAGFDAVYMAHGGDFPGVVNASFGLDLGSDEVDCFWPTDPQAIDAVTLAIESLISDKSIATVASANNGYAGHAVDARCTSPAGVSEVITVGGFDSSGAHLDETMTLVVSNGGPGVDVHAPGSNIASASIVSFSARRPDLLSGTSFSAAHVTGCVARYLQHWPWETPFGVHSSIVGFSTTGLLTGLPPNTPNRALFCPTTW